MKRNSGIISSSRVLPSKAAAPGVFDLFDNKNAKTVNIWPINYNITSISPNGGTTYENTQYTINVSSTGVELTGQTIYWEIIFGTNSNSGHFSTTSGTFTQSSSQTGSFSFVLNYTGNPSKGTANWQIRLREDNSSGRILFTSNTFNTPAISLNSSWSTNPVNEGSGTYLNLYINNCGTYNTHYHYIGVYTGTTSSWADFDNWSDNFYLWGSSQSYYYQLKADVTTEGTENFQFALYSGAGYNLGTISSLGVNDTSQTPSASVSMTGGVTSDTVNEGSTVTFTSTLTNFSSGTLYWTISAGSGLGNSDFSSPASAVTAGGSFSVSSSTGSFNLTINPDYFTEGTESFTVQIRLNSTSGTVIGQSSSISINDSTVTPAATISLSATTIDEGTSVTATVNTSNYPTGTLYWDIVDFTGNYKASDFSSVSGSFAISSNAGSFTVTPASDGYTEGAESFKIRIRHLIPQTTTYVDVVTSSIINITDTSTGGSEPSALYSFSSFTFTNVNITGQNGPTLANCLSVYNTAANTWLNNTSFFNVITQGIQLWTVPVTGSYTITAKGARGGTGNAGTSLAASCTGTFSLTQGDIIKIMVGQAGGSASSGCSGSKGAGGGGTFVTTNANSPLIVAGGGGGVSADSRNTNYNANPSNTSGSQGQDGGGAGGTGGGGGGYTGSCVNGGAGGGGLNSDGMTSPSYSSSGGKAFVNGGQGGSGYSDYGGSLANGGFGGGGGASTYQGGGGGGYSGGGGGGVASCNCSYIGGGGGGGSYNNGASQTNTTSTDTHGSVIITLLG